MTQVIEVAFKGNRKEFFLWDQDELPSPKAPVIVEADRGEDLGRVHATGELATVRAQGTPHGIGNGTPERRAKRIATEDDVLRATQLRAEDEDARRKAMERVKANHLVMKLSDAEWQWDRKKLTFYFTAERRVDFRTLVRELASMFRTRIELKQIGVRDEAKRLDGIGRCGRQYCSSSWLPELRPVNLGVAKDQKLSLNPSQISGACGRLMCCLRYEHDFYVQQRRRFPKEGKTVQASLGEEKVVANDIFRERVTLRSIEGEHRIVPLAELRAEMEAAAPEQLAALAVAEPYEAEASDDVESLELEGGAPSSRRPRERRPERTERPARPARPERAARPERPARAELPEQPVASAPIAAEEPTEAGPEIVSGEVEATDAAGEAADKRPPRRRGRRGGRRNRGGPPRGNEPRAAGDDSPGDG